MQRLAQDNGSSENRIRHRGARTLEVGEPRPVFQVVRMDELVAQRIAIDPRSHGVDKIEAQGACDELKWIRNH